MPRYFFEVENEETRYEDPEGGVYADDHAAVEGALRFASELLERGGEFLGATLTVLDEARDKKITVLTIRPPDKRLQ